MADPLGARVNLPGKSQWPTPRTKVPAPPDYRLRLLAADPPRTRDNPPAGASGRLARLGAYPSGAARCPACRGDGCHCPKVHTGAVYSEIEWPRNTQAGNAKGRKRPAMHTPSVKEPKTNAHQLEETGAVVVELLWWSSRCTWSRALTSRY